MSFGDLEAYEASKACSEDWQVALMEHLRANHKEAFPGGRASDLGDRVQELIDHKIAEMEVSQRYGTVAGDRFAEDLVGQIDRARAVIDRTRERLA